MAKARRHEIQILDKTTGQVLDFLFVPRKGLGGRWMRLFQDGIEEALKAAPHLQGQSLRVLWHLVAKVGWRNVLPTPAESAHAIGIDSSNAYKAYGQLLESGFVWKHDGVYYLSPRVGWKGNEAQLEEARATVFAGLFRPLTVATRSALEGKRLRAHGL